MKRKQSGRGPETDSAVHVRQRVHALHVQLTVRLLGRRFPENGAPLRPDLLGHQPGLRRRLPAVAAARLPAPHAAAHQLGHRHPQLHPDAHHRTAPAHARPQQSARFHRRPAQSRRRLRPRRRQERNPSRTRLESRPLRTRGLSRRPLGHRQPADEGRRRAVYQPERHAQHPGRDPQGHRRSPPCRPRGSTSHALHRGRHSRNAQTLLVAHCTPRGHAGHFRCRYFFFKELFNIIIFHVFLSFEFNYEFI